MQWDPTRTGRNLQEILVREDGPVVLVAPFVKEEALRCLCNEVNVPITLYTRWMPHEVAAGISDLKVLDLIAETGGEVRLHPRLHAKLYLRGTCALVGSANTTLTGLGFRDPAGVELLVPVTLPNEPVSALLGFLKLTTPKATEADREAVAERARQCELPAVSYHPDCDEAYPDGIQATPLIEFRDPKVAWPYYSNPKQYDQVLVRQLLRSLAGLGVPPSIHEPHAFHAAVGAGMRQGIHGRVLRECHQLPAYAAVVRYREIMSQLGIEIPVNNADESWRTFCYWAQHFVPEIRLRPTQVGF